MRFKMQFLFCLLLLTIIGCGGRPELRFEDAPVIVITIDTLRSDRLPVYGYDKIETPAIDAFAAESILFEKAWAQAPMTLPSHASLFTGKLPPNSGVRENVGFKLAEQEKTLAESLKAAGYQTGAAVSTMVLRKATGIGQGFDYYNDAMSFGEKKNIRGYQDRPGPETLTLAEKWIDAHKEKPFFFWLHLYEPHSPYAAPQLYRDRYKDRPYDAEIAYSDALLGQFFQLLKDRGIYDKAIIVLLSDHGEGLGEHGEAEHGLLVYRESIQVPLITRLPGAVQGGSRISETVGLIDVTPTVLDLLGLPLDPVDGIPLLGRKAIPKNRPIYSEAMTPELLYGWYANRSVVQGEIHYIETFQSQVFDISRDPEEHNNLFGSRKIPDPAIKLMDAMKGGKQETSEISPEEKAMLESLGYTGGFESSDSSLDLSLEAFLKAVELLGYTSRLINENKYEEARAILEKQLNQYPDMLDFRLNLVHLLNLEGEYQKAEYLAMEGLATSPNQPTLLLTLVAAQLGLKKFDEAGRVADRCMELAPVLSGRKLVLQFFEAGDYRKTAELAGLLQSQEPDFAFAYSILATLAADPKADVHLELEKALGQARATEEQIIEGLFFLGDALARFGRYDDALPVFEEGLRRGPDHGDTRCGLSKLYVSMDLPRKAIEVIDQWVGQFPSRANYRKAAATMDEVGIKEAADFYRKESENYKE